MNKPLTLLYADDDLDDLYMVEEVLKEVAPQSRFISARDGQAALDKLKNGQVIPDLILLDLNMPRMGGMECLKQLKNNEALRNIPVIIYNTSSQSSEIEAILLNGAACFITKPSSMEEAKSIFTQIVTVMPNQLEAALRRLSQTAKTFIIC